jgi:beta-phosphoglucomutase-like phosphatase (HAD superfamily)
VTAGKPDPQVFLIAAARLEVPPSCCIVVEDTVAGVEAARRAGMRGIGVRRDGALPAGVVVKSLADARRCISAGANSLKPGYNGNLYILVIPVSIFIGSC